METLKIDIHNEQEKKVLLAFLDSLNYQYETENGDEQLNESEVREMLKRKADYLDGQTTIRPWNVIKNSYLNIRTN